MTSVNNNGVTTVNFAMSKNLTTKNTKFPHHNIHNATGHHLMEKHGLIMC
jgi:hypothetical protein